MPELPEVHTTAQNLNKILPGLKIKDVWSDYFSDLYEGKQQVKNKKYFQRFKKDVVGAKVKRVLRRAKNVLIELSNGKTILIHMKMTGHLLYGRYLLRKNSPKVGKIPENWNKEIWIPDESKESPLWDPYNRFIHITFSFSNGESLVLSDVRKFAKVAIFDSDKIFEFNDLKKIGPEPLEESFKFLNFKRQVLKKPNGKIKQVLMDQEIIAGIGNIYSDEILWLVGVHPVSPVSKIPSEVLKKIFLAMKKVLKKGIDFGGDSTSDYRTPDGKRGSFQYHHRAYQKTGSDCSKPKCEGKISKIKIFGRSAHFCATHQKLFS